MPLKIGANCFSLTGRAPVIPPGKIQVSDSSGKVVAQVLPVDMGASGGKIRPIIARQSGDGLALELGGREFLFTNRLIGTPGDQYFHEGTLLVGIRQALIDAAGYGGFGREVPRLVTVDTCGAGAKVVDDHSTLEPLFFYMHDQMTRGHQLAMERLKVSSETEALKRIQLATGGQATCPVYNIFHLLAIFEKLGAAGKNAQVIDLPGVIFQYLAGLPTPPIESSFLRVTLGGILEATDWHYDLLEELGLPVDVFKKTRIVSSGTRLQIRAPFPGMVLAVLGIIAGATHDTAGAMYALSLNGEPTDIYLSSGSWNVMGMPVSLADMTPDFLGALFIRNLGVEGATGGLFVAGNVQGGRFFDALMPKLGLQVGDYQGFNKILAAHDDVIPGLVDNMSPKLGLESLDKDLATYCAGQTETRRDHWDEGTSKTFLAKTLVLSEILGMRERVEAYTELMAMKGRRPNRILVGGGLAMNNDLMMAALADATGLPVERTVRGLAGFGNAILALLAAGGLAKPKQLKLALAAASSGETFEPDATEKAKWDELFRRYIEVKKQNK